MMGRVWFHIFAWGNLATFVYLTFFDGYNYNAWNWMIAIIVNEFLAMIWPVYWAILHWVI